jgi:NAD(P)H dehydrogenase (quinone)
MNKALRLCCNTLENIGESLDIHNLDREPGRIFVTGGSGVIGHRVATRLLSTGYAQVRLGTGVAGSLNGMRSEGAEIVDFSWNREATYANALKGVKTVFITIPHEKNWHKHFAAFIQACNKARVKHYVKVSHYLSRFPGDAFHKMPLVKRHSYCDELLKKMIIPDDENVTQMSFTILFASNYMSNPLVQHGKELNGIQASTTMYSASGYSAANYVSPNDLADVAVRTLLAPHDHYNKSYVIAGPELITHLDISKLLSQFFSKTIPYQDLRLVDYKDALKDSGTPQWRLNDLVIMQRIRSTGIEQETNAWHSLDFEKVCGHAPESFSEYLTHVDTMTDQEASGYGQRKHTTGSFVWPV